MRKVERRPLSERFAAPGEPAGRLPDIAVDLFYRRRRYFNAVSLAAFVLACGGAFILWGYRDGQIRAASVFVVAVAGTLLALRARARAAANGLSIRRIAPQAAVEGSRVEIVYELRNAGGFGIDTVKIADGFSGSSKAEIRAVTEAPLAPGTQARHTVQVGCDGGMGPQAFGPLRALVSDPLGIFEYWVTETDVAPLEILPADAPIGEFPFPDSAEARAGSWAETSLPGVSVNFLGTREYAPGDPIRNVAWKLSARLGRVIVKEFENTSNLDVSLCIDMDPASQLGLGHESTWEYCKDAAISLLEGPLARAQSVQLLSQDRAIPFGRGDAHLESLVRTVTRMKPAARSAAETGGLTLLEMHGEDFPYGSVVVYILSFYLNDPVRLSHVFAMLRERAVRVVCVLVDGQGFTAPLADTLVWPEVLGRAGEAAGALKRMLEVMSQMGIPRYVVPKGRALREVLT